MRDFKRYDDSFKILWSEQKSECEVGVYSFRKEGKSANLKADLCDTINSIEDVLKERAKLRRQLDNDDLTGLLELQGEYAEIKMADFFSICGEMGIDMSKEIAFIQKNGQLAKWIDRAMGAVKKYQAELDQIKEGTEKYLDQQEHLNSRKRELEILLGLK